MEADQTADESQSFVAHVPVPSQKEVWVFVLLFFLVTSKCHFLLMFI